jgi:hypothetical protein
MTVEKTSPRVLRRVLLALVVIAAGALAVAPWAVEALVTPDTSTALTAATPASDPNHLVFDVLPILLVLAAVVVALAAVREVARGVRVDRDRERSRS